MRRALAVLGAVLLPTMFAAGVLYPNHVASQKLDTSAYEKPWPTITTVPPQDADWRDYPPETTTTTKPKPKPTTTTIKRASRSAPRVVTGDIWGALGACESGNNPRAVSGSGRYRGAFQFSIATWQSLGYSGDPIEHSYETQLKAAKELQERSGWGQWPSCARKLGLI